MVSSGAAEPEVIETGEKRDTLGRRRTPRERLAELLMMYKESGLTQRAIARREGVNYTTFCAWVQAERERTPSAPAGRKCRSERVSGAHVPFVEGQ
jgi:transposase-like protein